ncbi:MAG: hypothetical protein GF308_20935 [Candidatus Heimdallarchaeota archaeon]|nr:hypothetical protein [Candidatus Heimdallarchaeota archaeon]
MKDNLKKKLDGLSDEIPAFHSYNRYIELLSGLGDSSIDSKTAIDAFNQILQIGSKGLANELAFQYALAGAIIPEWVADQLDSKRLLEYKKMGLGMVNNSLRNWAELSILNRAGSKIIISPSGLVSPQEQAPWSFDFWVVYNNKLLTPVTISRMNQRFKNPSLPTFETLWAYRKLQVKEEFFTIIDDGRQLFYGQYQLKNKLKKAKKVTAYLALRPFSTDSIGQIRDIDYDPKERVFYLEQRPVFRLLGTEPTAVFVHSLRDGELSILLQEDPYLEDLSERYNRTCIAGLCHALIKYDFSIKSNQRKSISLVSFTQSSGSNARAPVPDFDYARDLFQKNCQDYKKRLIRLKTKDKTLTEIFNGALVNFLMNYHSVGDRFSTENNKNNFLLSPQNEAIVLSLIKIGLIDEVKNHFQDLSTIKIQKILEKIKRTDIPAKIIWMMGQICEFSEDLTWVKDIEKPFWEIIAWLQKSINAEQNEPLVGLLPRLSNPPFDFQRKFIVDYFWLINAFQAASLLAQKLDSPSKAKEFEQLAKEFQQRVIEFVEDNPFKTEGKFLIPTTARELINLESLDLLIKAYPLDILPNHRQYLKNTFKLIKEELVQRQKIFSRGRFPGILSRQTAELAYYYCKKGERGEATKLINWFLKASNPKGFWPEVVDPQTNVGINGKANDVMTAIFFIQCLRDMFIQENPKEKCLVLFKSAPKSLLTKGKISLVLPTSYFGRIALKANLKDKIQMKISIEKPPEVVEIILPFELKGLEVHGTTIQEMEKNKMVLKGNEKISIVPSKSTPKYGWRGSRKLE